MKMVVAPAPGVLAAGWDDLSWNDQLTDRVRNAA